MNQNALRESYLFTSARNMVLMNDLVANLDRLIKKGDISQNILLANTNALNEVSC